MANIGQKFNRYSQETKLAVVKEFIEKGTSPIELAYRYGVKSQESIMQWVKKYKESNYDPEAFVDHRGLATGDSAVLKGRPRKKFSSEEEKLKYEALVKEHKKEKAAEKRRIAADKKRREKIRAAKALKKEIGRAHV